MAQANTSIINASQVIKAINTVSIKNLQGCGADVSSEQIVNITANNSEISNILVNQTVTANIECFGQTENQVMLATQIAEELTAAAKANADFLLGFAFNTSAVQSIQTNNIVQNAMITNIQQCNLSAPVKQDLNINASYSDIVNVTLNQQANFFCKCVFGDSNITNLADNISAQMSAEASAVGGYDFSLIVTVILIAVAVIGAIVILTIVLKLLNSYIPDKKWTDQNQQYQEYLKANGSSTTTQPLNPTKSTIQPVKKEN